MRGDSGFYQSGVRAERRRTKKLIVAFHFHLSNRAAWKCDSCRRSGSEKKRGCGWIEPRMPALTQPVWVRGQVALTTCPVAYVTALSWSWLEQFYAWKLFGNTSCPELPAPPLPSFSFFYP